MLVGLVVIFPRSGILGVSIGTFFGNILSPLGPIDLLAVVVFIPTLLLIGKVRNHWSAYLAGTLQAILTGIYVSFLLNFAYGLPIEILIWEVAIPEWILITIGIGICKTIKPKLPSYLLWEGE